MKELWDARYQPADAEIVKRKATKFARSCGKLRLETADAAQEMATQVFQSTQRHDPKRGSREKFVGKVAENRLLNLIETRSARKRDDRHSVEYGRCPERSLIDSTKTQSKVDLQIEMRAMAAAMSPDVREIYDLALEGYCEAGIVNHLHISRQRVRTLMLRVKEHICAARLDDYVDRQPNEKPFL